jgi:hypothetical protein
MTFFSSNGVIFILPLFTADSMSLSESIISPPALELLCFCI